MGESRDGGRRGQPAGRERRGLARRQAGACCFREGSGKANDHAPPERARGRRESLRRCWALTPPVVVSRP